MTELRYVTEFKRWQAATTPEQQAEVAAGQVKMDVPLTPKSVQSADTAPNGKPFGQCTPEEKDAFARWYSALAQAAQQRSEHYEGQVQTYEEWAARMRGGH